MTSPQKSHPFDIGTYTKSGTLFTRCNCHLAYFDTASLLNTTDFDYRLEELQGFFWNFSYKFYNSVIFIIVTCYFLTELDPGLIILDENPLLI